MDKEDFHKTLERLRCELNTLAPEAGPIRERVNSLINDLEQHQDLENPGHRATIRNRLATLIEQLESKHPAISGMLNQIMTTLTGLGI